MRVTYLLLGIIVLVACGDDTSGTDSGTAVDSGAMDGTVVDSGPGDSGSLDSGSSDSGTADTGSIDAGPESSPGAALRTAQDEARVVICTCLVGAGNYPDLDACTAAMPLATDPQVECIDGALLASPADSVVFECKTDVLEAFTECIGSATCADLLGGTGTVPACREAMSVVGADCGDVAPAVADALRVCTT